MPLETPLAMVGLILRGEIYIRLDVYAFTRTLTEQTVTTAATNSRNITILNLSKEKKTHLINMVRDYIEVAASWLFKNQKHRDDKCFIKSPAFASLPAPTIKITSPDYPSADDAADGTPIFSKDHMHPIGKMPALEWDDVSGVKQWLLVCEDPDAPLPTPICHGVYLGVESSKRSTRNDEMEVAEGTKLKGGFYHGQSRNGMVYIPPRPLLNHGFHRCEITDADSFVVKRKLTFLS